MHTYLFFSILLILICAWYFSVCPSLSLSFFQLVCFMAPKHKSTPSQNPLRSRATSSSPSADSTPSHVRFCDEKAHTNFSKNFSRHDIHSECQVVLLDFSNTGLPTVIYSGGWESLYGITVTCPSMIIEEFYSNMHWFDYSVPHFITHIRGMRIVVTPDLISEVLHVSRVAHRHYPGYDRLKTVSKDELSSLFCETSSS